MTRRTPPALATLFCALSVLACGGSDERVQATTPAAKATRRLDASINDRSLCEWKGRRDREVSETAGPGALTPNVRRVWQIVGSGDDRRKVLVCREVDTNFDGVKDVVRRYNENGESLHEEADINYDGRIDTWITFTKGRLAEVRVDSDGNGKVDEWKFYSSGKLARVRRDTNRDNKPDVWEIYQDGKLERMGVDVDGDERVDRWDHDNEVRRRLDEAERKKEEEAAKKAAAAQAAAAKANQADDDGDDGAADTKSAPTAAEKKGTATPPDKKDPTTPAGRKGTTTPGDKKDPTAPSGGTK